MAFDDRTEPATPQKRKEARKKGQVARSTDLTSTLALVGALFALKAAGPALFTQMTTLMTRTLIHVASFQATEEGVRALFLVGVSAMLTILAPVLGVVAVTGIVANVAQVGFGFTPTLLAPDFSRIDPIKGASRLLSVRGAMELLKSMAKITILGYVALGAVRSDESALVSLGVTSSLDAARITVGLIWKLCVRVGMAMLVIAAADYAFQRTQHEKSIRMTKQEVKEEMRRSEGDPLVKAQFRQRHRQMVRRRMLRDVPKADVVVTNPTHLAVALQYDSATMAAPRVVAKGERLIAQRIKAIAAEHGVPCVENKPVARALFAAAEIGDTVPVELYRAVAEILAFVYRLRPRGRRPA